jgi:chromosomal replication initiation ATPase DnaA
MHQLVLSRRWSARNVQSLALETKSAATRRRRRSARRAAVGLDASAVPTGIACRIVRQLVLEMTAMAGERSLRRRDVRRTTCHVRQIAMYVCHVVLRLSMADIGAAFGRDRTTVGHACNVVEDRRDDAAFDAFVSAIERLVLSVFGPAGIGSHA